VEIGEKEEIGTEAETYSDPVGPDRTQSPIRDPRSPFGGFVFGLAQRRLQSHTICMQLALKHVSLFAGGESGGGWVVGGLAAGIINKSSIEI